MMQVTKPIDVPDDVYDSLSESMNKGRIFERIASHPSGVVSKYERVNDTELLFLKNVLDEDDELLRYICFRSVASGNTIQGEPVESPVDENDEYERMEFTSFTVTLNRTRIEFTMTYDSRLIPKYIRSIIQRFFDIMFTDFISSL
jgi:hypothetical protein